MLPLTGDAECCPLYRLVLWRGSSENGPLGTTVPGALRVSFTASVKGHFSYKNAETKNIVIANTYSQQRTNPSRELQRRIIQKHALRVLNLNSLPLSHSALATGGRDEATLTPALGRGKDALACCRPAAVGSTATTDEGMAVFMATGTPRPLMQQVGP